MPYLVFDARRGAGYLFETRNRWFAHAFCVVADFARRLGLIRAMYDYDAAMDFTPYVEPCEEERNWNEVYHNA